MSWTSFVPALGVVNFALADGAVLWIVSEGAQTIAVGGSSPPASDQPITGTLEAGAGPDDPLISRFTPSGGSLGDITSIELFGPHSDDASFTESANIFVAGEADPITLGFNEDGWPVNFQAPDGTTIEVIYGATTAEVHYLLPSGEFGVETVPLTAEDLDTLDELREDAANSRDALGIASATVELEAAQDDPNRVATYVIDVIAVDAQNPDTAIGGARVSAEVNGFPPDSKQVVHDAAGARVSLTWSINVDQELARANRQLACERSENPRKVTFAAAGGAYVAFGAVAGALIGGPPGAVILGTAAGGLVALTAAQNQVVCDQSKVLGPPASAGATVTIRVTHPLFDDGEVRTITVNPLEIQGASGETLVVPWGEAVGQFCPTSQGLRASQGNGAFDPDSVFAPPGFTGCPTDKPALAPLQITGVVYPTTIVSGAAAASLTVTWSGDAVGTLTLSFQPRTCPPATNCITISDTFDDPGSTLVFEDAVFCIGFSEAVFFDYEVVLSDESERPPVSREAGVDCVPS